MRRLWLVALALLVSALLAGGASALSAGEPPGKAQQAERRADALTTAATKRKGLPRRCRDQRVTVRMGRAQRIRLRCVRRNGRGKVVMRVVGGGRWLKREIAVRPKHGRLRRLSQRSGMVTYVPRRGFAGRDRFGFALHTRLRGTFRGRVAIRVVPPARPQAPGAPSCRNGSATVPYGGSVELTLPCGGAVTRYELLSTPQKGRLGAMTGDKLTYTQTARAAGGDEFSFRAVGPGGASNPATMTVTIAPPPAPTCQAQDVTTREGVPVDIGAACSGVDADYEIVSPPAHGSLTPIGETSGRTVYTPAPSWFSPDDPPLPDSFTVTAVNAGGAAPPTPIRVTVLPDPPSCQDVSTRTSMDETEHVPLPCGDRRSEPTWEIVDGPDHGMLGPIDQTTGRVAYTPDPGYVSPGPPDAPIADSFTFRAANTGGQSTIATARVVTVPPPPVCEPLNVEVDYETPRTFAASCVSEGGAEQRYELTSPLAPAAAGVLTPDPGFADNGQLSFSPASGFFTAPGEAATFGVRAVNAGGASRTVVGRIQVDEPAPSCDDYYGATRAGQPLDATLPCEELPGGAASFSIVDQPPASQGSVTVLDATTGVVRFTPAPGYFVPEGGSEVEFTYQASAVSGGASSTGVAHVDVLPPPPTCSPSSASALYMTPVEASIDCDGPELDYEIVAQPSHGELSQVSASGAVVYTPAARHAGADSFTATASNRGGRADPVAISVETRQWQLRAIGDSVSAGFGFYANGSPMSLFDLLDCKPPATVNNRCSSNSSDGPGYNGTVPHWTPDYGLANDVAWPAQFANNVQGGGHVTAPTMFRNQAVTGSAPADWLPGGALAPYLTQILGDQPDLLTLTLGANPLLSEILLTGSGAACAFRFTVANLKSCVQPFIDGVQLPGRLQQLYTQVLESNGHTQLVVMPYHLAIPYANAFSAWQLELMVDMINDNVAAAVQATKAALPADQAARLHWVQPSRSPQDTDPLHLPRFNVGLPASSHDAWSGTYDCHWYLRDVDGPSNQSSGSQSAMATLSGFFGFCSGDPWILSTDTGIHPNQAGYARFAATLENVAQADDLVPPLP